MSRRKYFISILFAIVFFCFFSGLSAFNFNPSFSAGPSFRNSQLYSVNVGLENITGYIGYFGDFNSDRYTDVFVINQNQKVVYTYLWNPNIWNFEMAAYATVDVTPFNITLAGIIAADFNNDGKLDLLVEGRPNNNSQMMRLILFLGNYTHLIFFNELLPATNEVSVFDWNGDLRPDLIGTLYNQNNTQIQQRVVWLNIGGTFQIFNFGDNITAFAYPNANAFVDLNGDCVSDLFLAVQGSSGMTDYEIWVNQGTNFTFYQRLLGITGAGQLSFADFDGDGNIDVLVPICVGVNCSIQSAVKILYNSQMSICVGFGATNCRKDTNLCVADPSFSFPNFNSTDTSVTITLPTSSVTDYVLSTNPLFPGLTIRVGDYNVDGYPDILVPVMNPKDGSTYIQLWVNVECSSNRAECTNAAIQAKRRTFSLVVTGVDALNIRGGFAATFFDLDEDGTNDLFVLSETNGTQSIHAVYNNFDNDAYFLKTLSLNGLCLSWCPGDIIPNPKPYGVNQHGAMFKWTATDLANVPRTSTAGQLTQSNYLALQTPYVFFGLGRVSNYVDYLWVGLPSEGLSVQKSVQYWPGIIPNSQVVIIPYPPSLPDEWTAELYVNPGGALVWITLAFIGALVVIGIIVWILTCQEKKQDAKAKRETEHLFSFKAM